MRKNYDRANNINYRDGDLQSTKHYRKDELDQKTRMYNSPVKDRQIGEGGLLIQNYDTKKRYTLVSDKSRVYKGGSWRDREYWLDPSQRRYLPEYMSTNYIGFRCSTDRLGPMKSAKTTKKKITN
jgi:gliding motility-associated lipoprotein GldJ